MHELAGTSNAEQKTRIIYKCLDANFTQITLCAIAGFCGTNEFSVLAMLLWISINFTKAWKRVNRKLRPEDAIIIAIGVLCLSYWSFNDNKGIVEGLENVEIIKSIVLIAYFASLVRIKREKIVVACNGLGLGLWLFSTLTLIGSLATQPFQSARGPIYDIFSGEIGAGSIYVGYSVSYALLIFFTTKSRMVWPATITALIFGVHAQNRNCLVAGLIILIYLAIDNARKIKIQACSRKITKVILSSCAIAFILIVGRVLIETGIFEKIIGRFSDLSNDVRITMNLAGYTLLAKGLLINNFQDLVDTSKGIQMIFPGSQVNEPGWHNLVLDSTRAAGWLGLTTSLIWFFGVILFTVKAAFNNNYKLLVAGIVESLNLIIIMPVALGGHHLLGSITVTTLIVSREFRKHSRTIPVSRA